MKMSPTGLPARCAIMPSVSANWTPSSSARSGPTVDFPEPGGPMRTTTGPGASRSGKDVTRSVIAGSPAPGFLTAGSLPTGFARSGQVVVLAVLADVRRGEQHVGQAQVERDRAGLAGELVVGVQRGHRPLLRRLLRDRRAERSLLQQQDLGRAGVPADHEDLAGQAAAAIASIAPSAFGSATPKMALT